MAQYQDEFDPWPGRKRAKDRDPEGDISQPPWVPPELPPAPQLPPMPAPSPAAPTPPPPAPPSGPAPFDPSRVPAGIPMDWARNFIANNPEDYGRMASAYGSTSQPSAAPQRTLADWLGMMPPLPAPTPYPVPAWAGPDFSAQLTAQNKLLQEQIAANAAREQKLAQQEQERRMRSAELYKQLQGRATQALNVSPEDPIISGQVEAFRGSQGRALRDFLSNAAESGRPLGPAARAIAAEKSGQSVSSLQAQLLARELEARRNEIAASLTQMGGMLSDEDRLAAQREIENLDNAIALQQQGLAGTQLNLQGQLGFGDLDLRQRNFGLDQLRTELANRQFFADLGSRNDQFLARLGFDVGDRNRYYDLVERGMI